jgi:hypothetical protein
MATHLLRRVFVALLIVLLLGLLPIGIWLTVKSTDYLRVLNYTYDPRTGDVTMERQMLQGDAMVRSYIAVTGADGRSCFYRSERVFDAYDGRGMPVVKEVFGVSPELKPCLAKRPYSVVGRYYVRAFGGLLLKPAFYFEPPRDGVAQPITKGDKGDTGPAGPQGKPGVAGKPG